LQVKRAIRRKPRELPENFYLRRGSTLVWIFLQGLPPRRNPKVRPRDFAGCICLISGRCPLSFIYVGVPHGFSEINLSFPGLSIFCSGINPLARRFTDGTSVLQRGSPLDAIPGLTKIPETLPEYFFE